MRRRARLGTGLVAGALVVAGATTVGVRAATAADGGYRTATVTRGDVEQTVSISGTVDATQRDDVAAAAEGTVTAVVVETGDRVRAGQVVARLDRTDAARAVRRARAAVDQARLDLRDAVDGQTAVVEAAESTTSTPTSTPDASSAATPQAAEPTTSEPGAQPEEQPAVVPDVVLPSVEELGVLQTAVTEAQTAADVALADAGTALESQVAACAAAYGRGEEESTEQDALCDTALATVEAAQQAVSEQQAALDAASDALGDALLTAVSQTGEAATLLEQWAAGQATSAAGQESGQQESGQQESGQQDTAQPATQESQAAPSATSAQSTQSTGTTEAATTSVVSLAAAQAALDAARADRVQAQSDLAATRVVAARAGTVTSVAVAAGDEVSAGDAVAVVVGREGATVTAELSSSEVADVAVGQAAVVALPGSDRTLSGEVTWVSRVATSAESTFPGATTSSYVVELAVPAAELGRTALPQGARADATIVVGTTEDALVVPTSALSTGTTTSVRVLDADGAVSAREVEVGRTGDARTAIRSGLEEGDVVVLADLDAEVDAAGEVSSEESGFPGGMVGGGGMPPGARP